MTRTPRLVSTALLLAALLALPRPAAADDRKDRAQALLAEGNALLDSGSYAEALATFQRAYETFPSPALLLNIGTALRGLKRYAEANNHYNRWLAATRRPKHRSEVVAAIAELDRMVGRVEIQISELDADLTIDGSLVDHRLYGGVVRVEPGNHEIAARKSGFRVARSTITVGAGEKLTVHLVLERPGTKATALPDDDDEEDVELERRTDNGPDRVGQTLRVGGITVAGVGVLSLAIGLKFGLDARRLSGDVNQLAASSADPALIDQKNAEGRRADSRFIAFTAIGGAALVAGGVLYVMGRLRGDAADDRPDDDELAVAPTVAPDLVGLSISGGF